MPASLANTHAGTPMGASLIEGGATFRVWAPNAIRVYVAGGFNGMQVHPDFELQDVGGGHWMGFIPGITDGTRYRFWIAGQGTTGWKRDPYARELTTVFPGECIVRNPSFPWHETGFTPPPFSALSIYQLHTGAFYAPVWPLKAGTFLDVADKIPYLVELGVNAVQLLPIQEFPGDFSLGYNGTDYFSPEMAFGVEDLRLTPYLNRINAQLAGRNLTPFQLADLRGGMNQLKVLIDLCHISGIAVIFDLVYNHAGGGFGDESLWFFDRQPGANQQPPIWFNSLYFSDHTWAGGNVFNFANPAVRQFLTNNARFFIDEYRVDGFRFDEVSVIDNEGRDATGYSHGWAFCQELTNTLKTHNPRVVLHAEYWPVNAYVLRETNDGGAGFHTTMTDGFRIALRSMLQAASYPGDHGLPMTALGDQLGLGYLQARWRGVNSIENHDLVMRAKDASDSNRMERIPRVADPSDPRSWFARSRSRVATSLLLTAPGIPMLFMGQEILEDKQWSDDVNGHPELLIFWAGLDAQDSTNRDFNRCVRELLALRRSLPALTASGFRLTHVHDIDRVLAFHRWVEFQGEDVLVVVHLGNGHKYDYRIGFPFGGAWQEVFNSDVYDNWVNPQVAGNGGAIFPAPIPWQGFGFSAPIVLPANSLLLFRRG
jgi:1,4-alpha-glucan branching enzyme